MGCTEFLKQFASIKLMTKIHNYNKTVPTSLFFVGGRCFQFIQADSQSRTGLEINGNPLTNG